eukprot:1056205-Prorocentrum_lima.AAC.1
MAALQEALSKGDADSFVKAIVQLPGARADVLTATLKRAVALLQKSGNANVKTEATAVHPEEHFVMEMAEVSCHSPRGRYAIRVGKRSLVLQPKSLPKTLHIPFESIRSL